MDRDTLLLVDDLLEAEVPLSEIIDALDSLETAVQESREEFVLFFNAQSHAINR